MLLTLKILLIFISINLASYNKMIDYSSIMLLTLKILLIFISINLASYNKMIDYSSIMLLTLKIALNLSNQQMKP